jgi:magnesium-transporting ATPase (P-type)
VCYHLLRKHQVPADIRLIKVTDMTVDNSNLTGEGDPQRRNMEARDPAVLEAENLAFMGTTVVNGKGFGIVIRRGMYVITQCTYVHTLLMMCLDCGMCISFSSV